MHTPFLPALRNRLAPMGSRTAQVCREVRAYTLCQLETAFAAACRRSSFPRHPTRKTAATASTAAGEPFWCLLWQCFHPESSGREVVRQLQTLFRLEGGPKISKEDGAYCRAKARLPLDQFPKALAATAHAADQRAVPRTELQGRPVKVVDDPPSLCPTRPRTEKPTHCCSAPTDPVFR